MAALSDSVRTLAGVGEKRAQALEKLGLRTLGDFLTYFPRDYEDRTVFYDTVSAPVGERVCIAATVGSEPTAARLRASLTVTRFRVFDGRGVMDMVLFNRPYAAKQLKKGEQYVFFGKVELYGSRRSMLLQAFEPLPEGSEPEGRLLPLYPLTQGVTRGMVESGVRAALACPGAEEEHLPPEALCRHGLLPRGQALREIHFPASMDEALRARRRMIFEELFTFSCALEKLKTRERRGSIAPFARVEPEEFFRLLPFAPTGAQRRAVEQIYADMCSGFRLRRLLQGDVGSGKTAVAAAAAYLTVKNGRQAVIMAPTEVLARQHYRTLSAMLEPAGISCALLCASLTAAQRREARAAAESGAAQVICGTHSLIQSDVVFKNAALFVVDEQHRFGVRQRAVLGEKGDGHLLVMSATPIPRTLTLIIYGDLDVSVLDEAPPGRRTVKTFAVPEEKRRGMFGFIEEEAARGGQTYIICPMIEDDGGETERRAVTEYAESLRRACPRLRVGMMHGRLRPAEKKGVMDAFAAGELDVLVSTTVVEVGVDVPQATVMAVEDAQFFGLSQLHQLRGRVGRGERQSYCFLLYDGRSGAARERLAALCRSSSGFEIAEADLALRGPGDFFGSRQHGLPQFRAADLATDIALLSTAREAAQEYLERDPELDAVPALRAAVENALKDAETLN